MSGSGAGSFRGLAPCTSHRKKEEAAASVVAEVKERKKKRTGAEFTAETSSEEVEVEAEAEEEAAGETVMTTMLTATTYKMPQEQIDDVLSWVIPDGDYVPVNMDRIDSLSMSEPQKQMLRAARLGAAACNNMIYARRREMQRYVKEQLELRGYVEMDDQRQMIFPIKFHSNFLLLEV
uniref:Uncharacterized protein n=1 Tax=Oryza punctata TaxID=4537 RepID=A0A0E0MFQ5_ORYPU